jgi:septum formation protein
MAHLKDKFSDKRIILASASPRRQDILKGLDIDFEIMDFGGIDETYPASLPASEVPVYLAEKKAASLDNLLDDKTVLITADTIVLCNDMILNKPAGRDDAIRMLGILSGQKHDVISGVCIKSSKKLVSFCSRTRVVFRELALPEIIYYVDNFQPFDKAGAYGIQEWIGYIGIESINGSYFNVVGLPVDKLYRALIEF